jgi:hypothetical protein
VPQADSSPVTGERNACEFGRMLIDSADVDHRTFRWPAQALVSIPAAAERLPVGGMARRRPLGPHRRKFGASRTQQSRGTVTERGSAIAAPGRISGFGPSNRRRR